MRCPDDGLTLSHVPLASAVVHSLMKGSLQSLPQHTRVGVSKRGLVLAAPAVGTKENRSELQPVRRFCSSKTLLDA